MEGVVEGGRREGMKFFSKTHRGSHGRLWSKSRMESSLYFKTANRSHVFSATPM